MTWRQLSRRITPTFASNLGERCFASVCDAYLGVATKRIMSPAEVCCKFADNEACWPTTYLLLYRLAKRLMISGDTRMVDLGCGSGRAVFYMAWYGAGQVTGIEYDPIVYHILQRNYASYRFCKSVIRLLAADSAEFPFSNENLIYMFNPFGRDTLKAVLANLHLSLKNVPRKVTIVYVNSAHHDVLDAVVWLRRIPLGDTISFTTKAYETIDNI